MPRSWRRLPSRSGSMRCGRLSSAAAGRGERRSMSEPAFDGIAVVGMAGRFPGAGDVGAFWRNLRDGVESVSFFSRAEMEADGVDPLLLAHPSYVPARAVLEGIDLFDAGLFGFNPRDAQVLDPQH